MRRSSKSSGKTPRNKVFVAFEVLLVSASEETGKKITADELKKIIKRFMSGTLKASEEAIYDGAVAACGVVARRCFGDNPDDDLDYAVEWVENADGTFATQVRPS